MHLISSPIPFILVTVIPRRFELSHVFKREISNYYILIFARRAGSDGSMFASGLAGPGSDPRRDSKF